MDCTPKAADVITEMSQYWNKLRATQTIGDGQRCEREVSESNKRGTSRRKLKARQYISELEAEESKCQDDRCQGECENRSHRA